MLEPEPAAGYRIVARPGALDRAAWPDGSIPLRIAPDEVLLLMGRPPPLEDESALVARDPSWVIVTLPPDDLRELSVRVSWSVPEPAGFAQGSLAGVPVKLMTRADGSGLMLAPRVFTEELEERLG